MDTNPDLKNSLRDVRDIADLGLEMPDGCRLSIRAWIPEDAEARPVPAIVEHLPYRKRDGTTARDEVSHPWMAARGYAILRVDMRGNGDSDGLMTDEYTQQELDDAVEVINWASSQPWCNGNVGMQGISWGGFNGLQVAALAPAPLKAIITLCSTIDRFADDIHYKGGCLLNENLAWSSTMWAYSSRPPDPALRDDWRDVWMTRLENEPFLISTWLRHQRRNAYWEHGSVCEDYAAIKTKVLAVSGWADGYKNTVSALVDNIEGAKGILGPWVHLYPHIAVPEPRIGFLQEAKRWWDRWLKDEETGVEDDPAMRMYLMEGHAPSRHNQPREGMWIADTQTAGKMRSLALGASGQLGGAASGISVRVASDATCGQGGSEYYAIGRGPELSGDQRADDLHSAVWIGDAMQSPVDIVGRPRLRLRLSADTPQGQIAVRLNHVHPDGQRTRITYGVLNLAHRHSQAEPEPLEPGRFYDVEVELDQIAYRVPSGHRIAVAVSTAYWPLIWPALERTELTITQGALELPERQTAEAAEWSFEPPDGAEGWQTEELRSLNNIRREEHDLATGEAVLIIEDDFGKRRDLEHGLVSGGVSRERWTIRPDNPLSARGETHWTKEIEREGLTLRTETYAQMWSDAQDFHLSGRIEAYENDILVYERDVTDKIARDHL
jgi:putative CocE/NonD family hydrolase